MCPVLEIYLPVYLSEQLTLTKQKEKIMKISINKLVDGINAKSHRKEDKFFQSFTLVSFDPSKTDHYSKGFNQPLDVRFYATDATVYCCIWGSINGTHFNGSGKAGGYGYDRASAAFHSALTSAGFKVEDLSGTGSNKEAVDLLAKLMGLEHYTIVHAHA